MPRREFASEKALKNHAELTDDFYAWESTATFAKWQRLLSRDRYEIVDVRTSQGVRRACCSRKPSSKRSGSWMRPYARRLG
jgi:hypothetical protein